MKNFFKKLETHLLKRPPVRGKRMPTFYPSAASCRDSDDPTVIHGACMRKQWYRCAGFSESDPSTAYTEYIFASGNMWEDWLTEKCKEMGIWLGNSIKWAIPEYHISGEIDILIMGDDGEPIIIENKTYSSSNYQAKKTICGLSGCVPTPKVSNVMQSALYLSYFSKPENGGIKKVLLTYMDRACGGPGSQQEFLVTLREEDGSTYIHIEATDAKGEIHSYDMPGITMESIFERYEELLISLQKSTDDPPPADFMHIYPAEIIEQLAQTGEIAKTRYEKWKSNPERNPIGYWDCQSYCGYRSLCKKHKSISGEA